MGAADSNPETEEHRTVCTRSKKDGKQCAGGKRECIRQLGEMGQNDQQNAGHRKHTDDAPPGREDLVTHGDAQKAPDHQHAETNGGSFRDAAGDHYS